MKPSELVKALVDRDGGESAVARAMGAPKFQGTLWKIGNGTVVSPKRESAERIAEHFGIAVDAIYKEAAATAEAQRLGINAFDPAAAPAPNVVRAAHPPAPKYTSSHHDPALEYGNEYLKPHQVDDIVHDLRELLPEVRLEWIQNLRRQADQSRKIRAQATRNRLTGKSMAASNRSTAIFAIPPRRAGDGNPDQRALDGLDALEDE